MKPPPAEQAWRDKIGIFSVNVWRIKSFFVTPRDQITWLKLHHRNLWVANRDPSLTDQTCHAHGCQQLESQRHLAICPVIKRDFWDPVLTLMQKLDMHISQQERFLLLGLKTATKIVDEEEAGILFLSWRCLYAEVVASRIDDRDLNLKHAYARLVGLIISRLKASGQKWYRWYSRTRGHQTKTVKQFPQKFRKRKLITTTATASYTINKDLYKEFDRIRRDRRAAP